MAEKAVKARVLEPSELAGLGIASGLFPNVDDIHELSLARAGQEPDETKCCDAAKWAKLVRHTRRAAVASFGMLQGCEIDWNRDGHRSLYAH